MEPRAPTVAPTAPFPLDVLIGRSPVLAKRGDNYYAVYVLPRLDEPVADLAWFRVRRMEALMGNVLPMGEDLVGAPLVHTGTCLALRLPERYQAFGHYTGYLLTEKQAEFAEAMPIPKPPGRLPTEWQNGRWFRRTARGWEVYRPGGWAKA